MTFCFLLLCCTTNVRIAAASPIDAGAAFDTPGTFENNRCVINAKHTKMKFPSTTVALFVTLSAVAQAWTKEEKANIKECRSKTRQEEDSGKYPDDPGTEGGKQLRLNCENQYKWQMVKGYCPPYCLEASSFKPGARLDIKYCTKSPLQKFTQDGDVLRPAWDDTLCVKMGKLDSSYTGNRENAPSRLVVCDDKLTFKKEGDKDSKEDDLNKLAFTDGETEVDLNVTEADLNKTEADLNELAFTDGETEADLIELALTDGETEAGLAVSRNDDRQLRSRRLPQVDKKYAPNKFDGDGTGKPHFEIQHKGMCFTNPHHPKECEPVNFEPCERARNSRTSYWRWEKA